MPRATQIKRGFEHNTVQTHNPQSHIALWNVFLVLSVVYAPRTLSLHLSLRLSLFPCSWVQSPNQIYITDPQDGLVFWVPGVIARNVCQAYGDPTDKYLQKVNTFTLF